MDSSSEFKGSGRVAVWQQYFDISFLYLSRKASLTYGNAFLIGVLMKWQLCYIDALEMVLSGLFFIL